MAALNPGSPVNVGGHNPAVIPLLVPIGFPSPCVGGRNNAMGGLDRRTQHHCAIEYYRDWLDPALGWREDPQTSSRPTPLNTCTTKGLPEDQHIGPDKKTSKITLMSWVNSIRSYMEERGLDTIFHIFDAPMNSEIYLLIDWGSARAATIKAWLQLCAAVFPTPTGLFYPCVTTIWTTLNGAGRRFSTASP
jgi:hypothetical protein